MQTLDFVSGLHNCQEFSQPLSCLYQAMQTRKTLSIYCFNTALVLWTSSLKNAALIRFKNHIITVVIPFDLDAKTPFSFRYFLLSFSFESYIFSVTSSYFCRLLSPFTKHLSFPFLTITFKKTIRFPFVFISDRRTTVLGHLQDVGWSKNPIGKSLALAIISQTLLFSCKQEKTKPVRRYPASLTFDSYFNNQKGWFVDKINPESVRWWERFLRRCFSLFSLLRIITNTTTNRTVMTDDFYLARVILSRSAETQLQLLDSLK